MPPAQLLKSPVKVSAFKTKEVKLELIINLLLAKNLLYKQHIYWKHIPKSPVLNYNTSLYNCTLWITSLGLKSLHTLLGPSCSNPSLLSTALLHHWHFFQGTGTAEGTMCSQTELQRQFYFAWLGKPKSASEKCGSYDFSGKLILNYEKQTCTSQAAWQRETPSSKEFEEFSFHWILLL